METRKTPNPDSKMLSNAVIGGAGLGYPPDLNIPEGVGVVILYVPIQDLAYKNPIEIQADLGLPWHVNGGGNYWFE